MFDDKTYVMGGTDVDDYSLSPVKKYDPARNEWVTMASMALYTGLTCVCAVSIM